LERVFVYGSLRSGACNHYVVAPFIRAVHSAQLTGKLYQMPTGYPMFIPGEVGTVVGEVLDLDVGALDILDQFEDYFGSGNPSNEYERICCNVWIDDAKETVEAFVYACPNVKIQSCQTLGTRIYSGDWSGYMYFV